MLSSSLLAKKKIVLQFKIPLCVILLGTFIHIIRI